MGKKAMKALSSLFSSLLKISHKQINKDGSQRYTFSIFAMLNYVAPMFIAHMANTLTTELILLRVAAIALCFGLCLADQFPPRLIEKYYPVYWYVTLWLCLPFLSSYTSFITHGEECWIVNMALSLILLLMLVSWLVFLILTSTGVASAYAMYVMTRTTDPVHLPSNDIYLFAYLCAFLLLAVLLFLRRKEGIQGEKIGVLRLFGGAIAHEVNSPLAATSMLANTLSDISNTIKENAVQSDEDEYTVKMHAIDYEMLTGSLPKGLLKTSQEAIKVVEILLLSLRDKVPVHNKKYDIVALIKEAVEDYAMLPEQKEQVELKLYHDFKFVGSRQLMKHVIYNLMRNAFKYSGDSVNIVIESGDNCIYFTDFGVGIPKADIKNIFKTLYTKSSTGTGIGLAFCSTIMKSVGGSIECKSEVNKYTTFILQFPVLRG